MFRKIPRSFRGLFLGRAWERQPAVLGRQRGPGRPRRGGQETSTHGAFWGAAAPRPAATPPPPSPRPSGAGWPEILRSFRGRFLDRFWGRRPTVVGSNKGPAGRAGGAAGRVPLPVQNSRPAPPPSLQKPDPEGPHNLPEQLITNLAYPRLVSNPSAPAKALPGPGDDFSLVFYS